MAEYPTEEAVAVAAAVPTHHVDPAVAEEPTTTTTTTLAAARARLAARRASQLSRERRVMAAHDFSAATLPSLQSLREERVQLSEQTRHHKDEQDSLTLDIEGQAGATALYQLAARVQRYEHFAARSARYVAEQLPQEVDRVVCDDARQSEEEIAALIQELQTRREHTLQKVSAAQQRSAKRGSTSVKPGDDGAFLLPASSSSAASPTTTTGFAAAGDEETTKRSIAHAESNVREALTLSEKVKKFRALKTKLSGELAREKRESAAALQQLATRLKNAELANARDARQCGELNAGNAALTANAQVLMGQLNVEHYGIDHAPTSAQLIESRRAREATPAPTPAADGRDESERRSRRSRGTNNNHNNNNNFNNNAEGGSVASSRQSKPPLVASKPTASQRSRDEAMRQSREEQQRRSSEAAAAASRSSSRRQSLSKPPLVASKSTASQSQRESEQSASRNRSHPRYAVAA